ncbi:MAG: adenylate/guanylate cyclase domain-containing protein [Burkholderiales bacterium]
MNAVLLRARLSACLEKKRLRDQQKELLRRLLTPRWPRTCSNRSFSLEGKRVRASILFCDIRDFTPMAEAAAPEETIELLNNYYALMFDAISGQGGVVNAMIGDGLMAVFGAHATGGARGARGARGAGDDRARGRLQRRARRAGKPPVRIGIGIASGEVVAGYTGTNARATYTCIGEVVNLAARIEQHTKVAQRPILIDMGTHAALPPDLVTDSIGAVEYKGFSAPNETFAVRVGGH